METITINAPEGKSILTTKEENRVIIDFINEFDPFQITTFKQAYRAAPKWAKDEYTADYNTQMTDSVSCFVKIRLIIATLNNGWKPDFTNIKQEKWFILPYFNCTGLWYAVFNASSGNAFGVRLCFPTKELAEYFWKHFQGLYMNYILL
jgi:hypothetical protein